MMRTLALTFHVVDVGVCGGLGVVASVGDGDAYADAEMHVVLIAANARHQMIMVLFDNGFLHL